jgi:hypothetical protein
MLGGVTGYGLGGALSCNQVLRNIRQVLHSTFMIKINFFHQKNAQSIDFFTPKLNR